MWCRCHVNRAFACTLRYTEGELHHQDMILNDEDHLTMFTPCCSKIKSKHIVIDL